MTLFDDIQKIVKKNNDFAFSIGEDNPYEVKEWIDTGCYALNAILSDGDIFKGLPTGKRIVISGTEATAKSILAMLLVKCYINKKKNSKIIFFESEGSSTVDVAKNMNIGTDQMIVIPVTTVEDCRSQMLNIVDTIIDSKFGYVTKKDENTGKVKRVKDKKFVQIPEDEQENFIFVLDSLGMLGTNKETNDISTGSDTKDMTRTQLIKAFARVISLKLSLIGSPFIIINHLYSTFDKYNPLEMSGGSGVKYAGDIILFNTKAKQKEGTEQIGVVLKLKTYKSRYMQENKFVKLILSFKKGLYKYSGLLEMAHELNVFKKEGISYVMPDGTKAKMKEVRDNFSKFATEINMNAIRDGIMENFGFGTKGFISDEVYEENDIDISDDSTENEDNKTEGSEETDFTIEE